MARQAMRESVKCGKCDKVFSFPCAHPEGIDIHTRCACGVLLSTRGSYIVYGVAGVVNEAPDTSVKSSDQGRDTNPLLSTSKMRQAGLI